MPTQNEQLVRRAFDELWSQGKLEIADEIFAPDYVNHDSATPDFGTGPEAEKQIVTHYRHAFPDLQFLIELMTETGDFVTVRFSAEGTHKGELQGIAPTDKSARIGGTVVFLFSGGRIAERWAVWDALGLMLQLGVVCLWGESADERIGSTGTQSSEGYKFGGAHFSRCRCSKCGEFGGRHSANCACPNCGHLGGSHAKNCYCPECGVSGGLHASSCDCPQCGRVG